MAKQQHIEWLCESVDSWNAKRLKAKDTFDAAFFRPDFTGADLSCELQKSVHERRRGLFVQGFVLDGIDLKPRTFSRCGTTTLQSQGSKLGICQL